MLKLISICWVGAVLPLAAVVAGCSGTAAPAGGPVRVEISHVLGAAPLQFEAATAHRTAAGEDFTVSKLRYYLSNVRLRRDDGQWFAAPGKPESSEGYHLIDAAVPASQQFELAQVPPGRYTGIEFLLGIDAARNHAGAQTGTLDPARGLFWSWKTGYIFFAFEGQSPQSRDGAKALTYHVGGEASAARTVFLPLAPKPARVEPRLLPTIHLKADVGRLFDAPQAIRFAELASAMDAKSNAPIADNAATLFVVDHLHHEPLPVQ